MIDDTSKVFIYVHRFDESTFTSDLFPSMRTNKFIRMRIKARRFVLTATIVHRDARETSNQSFEFEHTNEKIRRTPTNRPRNEKKRLG